MVNYILSNSVAYLKRGEYEIFPNIVNLKFPPSHHSTLYTALGALHQASILPLTTSDKVVFNVGINDCIFRKDKNVQMAILKPLYKESVDNKDFLSAWLIANKINLVEQKKEDDLFQILSFVEFENLIEFIFRTLKNVSKVIVLSINWFPPTNSYIGFAFEECIKTNKILKRKADEYGFTYIDLWKPNNYTVYDGVHLNKEGHEYVAKILK